MVGKFVLMNSRIATFFGSLSSTSFQCAEYTCKNLEKATILISSFMIKNRPKTIFNPGVNIIPMGSRKNGKRDKK